MIRTLPTNRTTPPVSTKPAHTTAKNSTATADFQKLFHPDATTPAKTTAAGTTTSSPPKSPDPITSSPYLPAGYPGDTDLMNKTQHEQTMNDWLQNYTKWTNDKQTQIYQQAMINWQQNDQHCQELGLAS